MYLLPHLMNYELSEAKTVAVNLAEELKGFASDINVVGLHMLGAVFVFYHCTMMDLSLLRSSRSSLWPPHLAMMQSSINFFDRTTT